MTQSPPELDLQQFLTAQRHAIHLIGVAGSGMSGIAALLLELGHDVRGSDKVQTLETERLAQLGLRFSSPHRAEDTQDAIRTDLHRVRCRTHRSRRLRDVCVQPCRHGAERCSVRFSQQ